MELNALFGGKRYRIPCLKDGIFSVLRSITVSILILAGFHLNSSGQDCQLNITSNMVWLYGHEAFGGPGPLHTYHGCYIPETDFDTTINGISYFKVMSYPDNLYRGAFRDVQGQIGYLVPPDQTMEYIVFDFTVSIGQSIDSVYVHYPSEQFEGHICELEANQVHFEDCPSLELSENGYCEEILLESSYWWEHSTLRYTSPLNFKPRQISWLYPVCISRNDTVIFSCQSYDCWHGEPPAVGTIGNCRDLGSTISVTEIESGAIFSIVNGNIIANMDIEHLIVSDVLGIRVLESDEIKKSETISLTRFPSGIYAMTASRHDVISSMKIIIP